MNINIGYDPILLTLSVTPLQNVSVYLTYYPLFCDSYKNWLWEISYCSHFLINQTQQILLFYNYKKL